MAIKNSIFCMLVCGLFFNSSNLLGSLLNPDENDRGITTSVLIGFKKIAKEALDRFDGDWTSLPKENIIESLNSIHYNDIINKLSNKGSLDQFKNRDPKLFSNKNITTTCLTLYRQSKDNTILNQNNEKLSETEKNELAEQLVFLNLRRTKELLFENDALSSQIDKLNSLYTTIFRWKIVSGCSLLITMSLFLYVFLQLR